METADNVKDTNTVNIHDTYDTSPALATQTPTTNKVLAPGVEHSALDHIPKQLPSGTLPMSNSNAGNNRPPVTNVASSCGPQAQTENVNRDLPPSEVTSSTNSSTPQPPPLDAEQSQAQVQTEATTTPALQQPLVSSASSRLGSRFSVNLSGVGLPAMASNLGLSQANSDRAADIAQDLKKNVVNMWNTWFPTPTGADTPPSSTDAGSGTGTEEDGKGLRMSSGTQSLSQHPQHRPVKTQRVNSYTMGAKSRNDAKHLALSPLQSARASSFDTSDRPTSTSSQEGTTTADGAQSKDAVFTSLSKRPEESVEGGRSSTNAAISQTNSTTPIYLMGKLYPPSPTQWVDFQKDFTNGLIWCTYRHSYAPIKPSNFTTDVGWGCMLRSGQGLLANALAIQFMGRGWSRPVPGDANWDSYVQILTWFLDDMSARSPFSVHRIALLGKQLGKNIGEWFGPSTTSQVTKALVHNFPESGLGVYVTTDGVIYKDQVEEAATLNKKGSFGHVLILATIRLGIDKLNPIYNDSIKATFEISQSLGIAGGRPSSSYYFVGYQGDELFYLDPHHSRCVVESKNKSEYLAEDFATYHCDVVRKIDINSIDPSMLLAFYCKDRDDFDSFCERAKEMNEHCGISSSIFSVGEKAPDYDDADGKLLSVADEEDDDLELIL